MNILQPPVKVLALLALWLYVSYLFRFPELVPLDHAIFQHGRLRSAEVRVSVIGEVERPGVYLLKPGQCVRDAIHTAKGPTEMADLSRLNLDAPLLQRTVLKIPSKATGFETRVSLSRSSLEELITLPGVGPALAQNIVAYRDQNGPYEKATDLLAVSGIGPKKSVQILRHAFLK
jgi:competence protein ComEA